MTRERELALVKEIIKDGYDNLDAISFELDIPLIDLIKLKRQIYTEEQRKQAYNQLSKEREKSIDKMDQLRRNYELIYNGIKKNSNYDELPEEIEDNVRVDNVINKIESMLNNEDVKRKNALLFVFSTLSSIKNEPFSMKQAEKMVSTLMNSEIFKITDCERKKGAIYTVSMCRKIVVNKLVEAIRIKIELTNNEDELTEFLTMLSYEIQQAAPSVVTPLKIRISSKINRIKTENAIYNMENNFPENVIKITEGINSDCTDIAEINKIIECELNELRSTSSKRRFLSESDEQLRTHIHHKVLKVIEKKSTEYQISNPKAVLNRLEQLFGENFDINIRAIVHNYIERGRYSEAEELCSSYLGGMDENSISATNLTNLRNEIKKAEIGQIILKGIRINATVEEKNAFFDFCENQMKKKQLNYNTIPLGYDRSGTRKITLADIWDSQVQNKR